MMVPDASVAVMVLPGRPFASIVRSSKRASTPSQRSDSWTSAEVPAAFRPRSPGVNTIKSGSPGFPGSEAGPTNSMGVTGSVISTNCVILGVLGVGWNSETIPVILIVSPGTVAVRSVPATPAVEVSF